MFIVRYNDNNVAQNPNLPEIIEWQAYECLHGKRTIDWFWGVGLVSLLIGVVALIVGNPLLAVLITIGAGAVVVVSLKTPELNYYALTTRGVIEKDTLYPWSELEVFWIIEDHSPVLLIRSKHTFVPILDFPIPETIDTQLIHNYMFQYLDDEPLRQGTLQQIMNWLGFY